MWNVLDEAHQEVVHTQQCEAWVHLRSLAMNAL